MRARLNRPALVTHAFFPARKVIGEPGSPARKAVDRIWAWARGRDYRHEIVPWSADLRLPATVSEQDSLQVLAAAARSTAGRSRELLVYQVYDVIGVSAVDAAQHRCAGWPDFDRGWLAEAVAEIDKAKRPEEELLGTAQVYSCLVRGRLERADRLVDGLTPQSPAVRPGLSWSPTAAMLVSEMHTGHARHRQLFAVAGAEATLDEWLWTSPGAGLPALTRYLLQAAQLRHQSVELQGLRPDFADSAAKIDEHCATLQDALAGPDVPLARILEADQALVRLSTEQGGVVKQLTVVRSMIGTVEAITHNLEAVGRDGQIGAADRRIADRTLVQLRTEESYLAAAQLRATEQSRLAAATVTTRLEDRKSNLTLLQTTIIGALLMALAVVQSLQYQVPLPGRVRPPTIALLAALALALPSAVLRWPRGGGRTAGWAKVEVAFGVLAGGALGWFILSLISRLTDPRQAHWQSQAWATGAGAAAMALICALSIWSVLKPKR